MGCILKGVVMFLFVRLLCALVAVLEGFGVDAKGLTVCYSRFSVLAGLQRSSLNPKPDFGGEDALHGHIQFTLLMS